MLMEGRVVLITGASRGIGAAAARLLAEHGAAVAINYNASRKAAEALMEEITTSGGKALAIRADVRNRDQVEAMVATTASHLGPIDTLVTNASIGFPMEPFVDYSWEAFEAKLTGELRAAFFPIQVVVPPMIERGKGCIVAVSSALSRHAAPGFCAHSTAKSGLDALVRSLALELGPHGIRVNAVAPGLTETDATAGLPPGQKEAMARMTPMRRNGRPEDVARTILAVASDLSEFVTGAYIPVTGGSLML